MILPDVNLLLYAYDSSSPHHNAAAAWWRQCMIGSDEVGLATVVVLGFVRLSTNSRVFQNPLTVVEAVGIVESWLTRANARVVEPSPIHLADVLTLLKKSGSAGNLTTDAQIAALALQESAILHSNDTDFLRFPGLCWHNPLTGKTRNT